MAQTLIIPGVAVKVVKDVVAPQLSPAGVLGLVGLVENVPAGGPARVASWSTFVDTFGPGSANSLPEARQALENGVTELVVVPANENSGAEAATADLDGLVLEARAPGPWANTLSARVTPRPKTGPQVAFDLEILSGAEVVEKHGNLSVLPGLPRNVATVLEASSSRVRVSGTPAMTVFPISTAGGGTDEVRVANVDGVLALSLKGENGGELPTLSLQNVGGSSWTLIVDGADKSTFSLPKEMDKLLDALDAVGELVYDGFPATTPEGEGAGFRGGADANLDALAAGLEKLKDYGDVDLVAVSIQDQRDTKKRRTVYSKIISHCEGMSENAKGRIGFGEVAAGMGSKDATGLAEALVSDRFVLLSPQGMLGAVAGRTGALSYFESPTFKTLSGVGEPSAKLGHEAQQELLTGRVVPIVVERGRGLIIVRGITTDADQISVRRVADRAVRGVKLIGDLFIGKLNNDDGRSALKQKLSEMLLQMQKDGALVPSTDGKDPAFQVAVYSSQSDFSQGIVRVEIAVRPVRAIDYIYATIRVQA